MKKRKSSLIVNIILVALVINAVAAILSIQLQISQKNEEIIQLEQQKDIQMQKNARLQSLAESEFDDRYVAEIARERLGFAMPGEIFFENISSK
jgi:cell division protein FtsB